MTESGRRRLAKPWFVALLVVGGVALGLAGSELLRRLPPFPRETTVPAAGETPSLRGEPLRLGSLSQLETYELGLFVALAVARFVLAFMRRRRLLEPLLDLPLIGLLLAVTGGGFSPLDPTLPLAYVAAIVFLRGNETGRASPGWLTLELLIGLVAIHLIAERHDRRRLEAGEGAQVARLHSAMVQTRADAATALASVDAPLEAGPGPERLAATPAGAALAPEALAAFGRMRESLSESQRRFRGFLELLRPDVDAQELGDAKLRWQGALDEVYDRYFRAREEWLAARPPAELAADVSTLDTLRETQWNVRQELLRQIDDIEEAFVERDRLRTRQQTLLANSTTRRVVIFGALLLFAALAVALRDRLSREVRAAEERRTRGEVELAEREKESWIALTAGLTHGLGNDILAYDVYLAELLRLLDAPGSAAPKRALELLHFLADSNRGRLAFLRFLDAFARQRQSAAGEAPPIQFEPLELVPLLSRVRANLARVEIADLPAEGSDPAVDRQIRLLRDLPLEVKVEDEDARVLQRGQRGVVEFFVYEMLKNALRSATGERPLLAKLGRAGEKSETFELALENDVQVELTSGTCPRCGQDGSLRRVRRRRDAPAVCERCFGAALQELLEASFAPGKGSGTGLGLFLIRYFLGAFWNGEIRARVVDPAVPTVAFTLALPDPRNKT